MTKETKEPTVEEALRELREMFPLFYVVVDWHEVHASEPDQPVDSRATWTVSIDYHPFFAQTLSDCMAQVRDWRKEQSK